MPVTQVLNPCFVVIPTTGTIHCGERVCVTVAFVDGQVGLHECVLRINITDHCSSSSEAQLHRSRCACKRSIRREYVFKEHLTNYMCLHVLHQGI